MGDDVAWGERGWPSWGPGPPACAGVTKSDRPWSYKGNSSGGGCHIKALAGKTFASEGRYCHTRQEPFFAGMARSYPPHHHPTRRRSGPCPRYESGNGKAFRLSYFERSEQSRSSRQEISPERSFPRSSVGTQPGRSCVMDPSGCRFERSELSRSETSPYSKCCLKARKSA